MSNSNNEQKNGCGTLVGWGALLAGVAAILPFIIPLPPGPPEPPPPEPSEPPNGNTTPPTEEVPPRGEGSDTVPDFLIGKWMVSKATNLGRSTTVWDISKNRGEVVILSKDFASPLHNSPGANLQLGSIEHSDEKLSMQVTEPGLTGTNVSVIYELLIHDSGTRMSGEFRESSDFSATLPDYAQRDLVGTVNMIKQTSQQ